jgi:hypothetical protein
VQTVPDDLENVAGVAFAPSGELLALYGRNGLHLIRIGGKWEKEGEVPVSGAVESVQFSAEDLRLLVVLDDHAEVWDVHEPKEPRPVLRRIPKDEETPAMLSADGQRVFTFVSGDLIRSDVISFDSPEDGKVLADLAETLGRVQVSEIGNVKPVDAGSTLKTVAEKHCRMRDPGACRVARWLLQPDGKETLSPVSQTSLADYIRIESARKSVQIWTSLATLFPGHPALGEKPPPPPATE